MDQKQKALKAAVTGIAVLALAMFVYYWVSWRTHRLDSEVNFSEKAETPKEEKGASDYAGVYSASEAIEGLNHRLAFFSLNKREDGSGYFGTAKVDPIGSETESATFVTCNDISISDHDFFVKCADATLGELSFSGELSKAAGAVQVNGKLLWSKGGTEITNKAITLTRSGG